MAPKSRSLISACCGNSVTFWDAKDVGRSGKAPKPTSASFESPVVGACWNSKGEVLVSVLRQGGVRISLVSGVPFDTVPSPTEVSKIAGLPTSISIAQGNKYVATGSDRGQLLVWDLRSMVISSELKQHSGAVAAVQYSPWSPHHLASASEAGEVLFHHTKDRPAAAVNMSRSNAVPKLSLAFSPTDQALLAAGAQDGTIALFDTRPQILRSSVALHSGPVVGLCYSHETLYSVDRGGRELVASDSRAPTPASAAFRAQVGRAPACLAARGDGRMLAVGCQDGHLLLYDARKASEPLADLLAGPEGAAVRSAAFQPMDSVAACTPEPPAPRVSSSWMASAAMSPMPVGGVSPLGAAASTFTPMQTGKLLVASGLQSAAKSRGRVPEAELAGTKNRAAAQEAAKLYSAKPPTPAPAVRRVASQDEPLKSLDDQPCQAPATAGQLKVPPASLKGKENRAAEASEAETARPKPTFREPGLAHPTPAAAAEPIEAAPPAQDSSRPKTPSAHSAGASGLQQMMDGRVEDLRDDIRNMHIELIRQFHDHQSEMAEAFRFIIKRQDALAEEVAHLRQQLQPSENQRRDPWF